MITITPLNSVFDRMTSLTRAMDQALGPATNGATAPATWTPAIDAVEKADAYLVTLDLPGVPSDKVDVSFERNTLTVRGERAPGLPKEDATRIFLAEREWGTFERSLRFPVHVEGDRIAAAFSNGVLTITVPKAEAARARKIEVR